MAIENLLVLTDEQLCKMAREGSETAEEILIEKYKGMVSTISKAYFIVGADSDDVVQEGMIGLMKAVRNFDPERDASFKTYAKTCISNQILTAIRNADREKNHPLNDAVSLENKVGDSDDAMTLGDIIRASLSDEPEEEVIYREVLRSLEDRKTLGLSKLEAAVLKEKLSGKSYLEIAETLGKSPKTIDNAQGRLKKKVLKFLES